MFGILYNFYTNMTSAPIVNTISKWLPDTRLIDYKILEDKVFTLGCEGETFELIISKEDRISIAFGFGPKAKKLYNTFDKKAVEELTIILRQSARNYTIDNILQQN